VRFRLSGLANHALPEALFIYDVHGRLVGRAAVRPGEAVAVWDGNDEAGRIAPAGLYVACWRARRTGAALRFVRLR
jgi:hypothetical protein